MVETFDAHGVSFVAVTQQRSPSPNFLHHDFLLASKKSTCIDRSVYSNDGFGQARLRSNEAIDRGDSSRCLTVTIVSSTVTNASSKAPLPDFEHRSPADVSWRMTARQRKVARRSKPNPRKLVSKGQTISDRLIAMRNNKRPLWAALPSSERGIVDWGGTGGPPVSHRNATAIGGFRSLRFA
jgi:hypothetical protein